MPSGAVATLMALVLEHQFKEFAHIRIVIHDQDRAGAASHPQPLSSAVTFGGVLQLWRRATRCQHHLDGEDRTLARTRTDTDPMAQQIPQALHDGQAEAEAAARARARRCRADGTPRRSPEVPPRECRCRCPRSRCSALPSRRRQPSSTLPRLVYFIALESRLRIICSSRRGSLRIDEAARDHPQDKSLGLSVIGELIPQPVKQIVDREIRPLRRGRCRPRSG